MSYVHTHAHRRVSLSQTARTLIHLEVCVYEYISVSKLYIHTICVNISINTVLDVNVPVFTYCLLCCPSLLKQAIFSMSIHPHTPVYKIASKLQMQSGQTVELGILNIWFVKIYLYFLKFFVNSLLTTFTACVCGNMFRWDERRHSVSCFRPKFTLTGSHTSLSLDLGTDLCKTKAL